MKDPKIPNGLVVNNSVLVASSPRFNMFGNDFGWGKPIAVRDGPVKSLFTENCMAAWACVLTCISN